MGKKSSSASAGTRKKHARKSGKDEDEVSTARPQRGQKRGADGKKLSKKERKALANVKQYIPPPKPPAPPIPDPLDGQGLARSLPAELVVVLRRLGKKDDVTRRKGLEELREQWVSPLLEEGGGEDAATQRDITAAAVEAALPVWLHNLSSLLQSPSHRTQALALHNDLLSLPHMRGVLVDTLAGGYLPGTQDRDIIGSWLVAALEEGRRAGGKALAVWDSVMRFEPPLVKDGVPTSQLDLVPHLPALAEYFSLSTLDPQTLHRDIHPAPVQVAFEKERPPTKGKKGALPKSRASPAPTPTPPVEEDTEVAEERWARYRVGGLVGLGWIVSKLPSASFERPPEEFAVLLTNPVLWSALGMVVAVPDVIPIGSQPPIRRAAYNLLSTVLDAYPAEVARAELLEIISLSVLSNCWQEKEAVVWEAAGTALLKFLTKNRSSWLVAPKTGQDDGDDSDDDDDDDEGSTQPTSRAETPAGRSAAGDDAIPTKAFDGFLEFVSTVCPSIPHLTYPLLVVIVSTVPAVLLPLSSPPSLALLNLFSHLWSPADARLLSTHGLGGQPSAFQAFLQSTADIAAYLLEKTTDETQAWLVKDQLGTRIWGEGVVDMGGKGGRRGAPPVETEAKIAAKAIGKVVEIAPNSLPAFMEEVERTTLGTCFDEKHAFLARALPALTLLREAGPSVHQSIDEIIVKLADGCTERLFEVDDAAPGLAEALVAILKRRPDLFPSERVHILSQGLQAHLNELVGALSPALIAKLFDAVVAVASADEKDALLSALWGFVTSDGEQGQRFALATGILGDGPGLIGAQRLDAIAREAVRAALTSDDAAAVSIASQAVVSDDWLSDQARDAVLSSVTAAAQDAVDDLLTECVDVVVPYTPFAILAVYAAKHLDKLVASDAYIPAVVAAHHLVVLVPRLGLDVSVPPEPSKIWAAAASLPEESKATLSAAISRSLAELLGRVSCRADPDALVDVALMTDLGTHPTPATVASTLLPPADEMLSQLAAHTSQPPHPALPVIDPQVPTGGVVEPISRASDFDTAGRSRAARYVEAGLALLRVDRSLVTTLPHLLNVALSAMVLASDAAAIPGASRGMYTPEASPAALEGVVRGAQGALSFSLSLIDEAPLAWHKATIEQLRAGKPVQKADYLQRLLGDLCASVAEKTSDVAPRAFYAVLSRHLRGSEAGEAEGEVWLTYAMQMSDKQPELAQAIILAIKPLMLDARAFDVAQNRLANALTGISIKNVNEKGVPALRLLAATAPPRDSLSVFLPQQRAVFVLRHVGGWLTSEDEAADDLSDEVDTRVAELYAALAPIVQDLSGAHWDGIFDLIESGLDSCALDDPESYPLLHAVLALLTEVRDLASSNKALRDLWVGKDAHLAGVVKLFLQCRDAASEPLQLIHAQLLDLLGDASPEVMAAAGLPELCELLSQSSSAAIQRTAYRVLAQVVRKSTAELVLEVEADVSEEPAPPRDIKLPADLVAIAEAGRDVDWHEELSVPFVTAQLLAWMAMLDHFDDASRTLRWAYLDQLTSTKLLGEALLPLLFAMLGVSEVGAWNFPASAYAVDEFYCDLLEPEDLPDLSPLASHVYYRTLVTIPSAMRAYYEGLKDRQLSLSLQAFTARNFSPVIIAHEFSALRAPLALAELTDEGLSIRIAQGGGGTAGAGAAEAIASYTVDEQPMEIGIRLPADFPLKAVDVRDLRRVGVPENKWRGWLMGVQQTITSRNGLILEALTVFKKNVALHFEGVVECAICYSIISLTDRTLPTKPCRTCKNRFHASCLFKWFNSSHTSSCPMCRSLF
ncbi:uncharacterized protein CcaverHIS019_0602800 [Cutaneotrichosporon cavernicola]|uniref:E3 ubiquitin-protein ligase listerin n=1 Tax=Cutaneotrichosporon cavernicola TaxID=279322 RepID=A0AA48L8H6_9TREE|nr:uncharacterized protein CcaverHIS019_0602800 [Cutaneotrichosporon cavernicola]BEI93821.1 hypothetical protein CcaverHIS019_0602800 [Cutaneotrichosporon cavernicola]